MTVVICALAVGGATVIGTLLGFIFNTVSDKINDCIMGFASGLMLSAAFFGLIIPAIQLTGKSKIYIPILGVLCGALFINVADIFAPKMMSFIGADSKNENKRKISERALLFVLAIAIHNFPQGMAAGVGFGTQETVNAVSISIGIAIQNIPEGMIIIAPLLASGASRKKTLGIGILTGSIEILGTISGYLAVKIANFIMPFLLSFAFGTLLYVICSDMIPQAHSHGYEKQATYSLILGFLLMLVVKTFI